MTTAAITSNFKGQYYGNVSHMPASVRTTADNDSTLTPTTATYGKVTTNTTYFDLRVVRFMPAQVAQSVWEAGNTLNTAY